MKLERLLAHVNRRYGDAGSVIVTVFWLAMVFYAMAVILSEFW